MTTPRTIDEAKAAGWVRVGEWGDYRGPGWIVSRPEHQEAVTAAYEEIEEGDIGPNTLDDVAQAGGVFVREDR